MIINGTDFASGLKEFRKRLLERSKASGPGYSGDGKFKPAIWHDQKFATHIEPAGLVNCPQALSVGRTLHNLEAILIASAINEEPVEIPAGTTITMSFMQADSEQGIFEDVGPTICVKAPAAGMSARPGEIVARFPLMDFSKEWVMVNLEFTGVITGGKVDCILSRHPHC